MRQIQYTTMGDIMARIAEIDDLDAAERAKTDLALASALEMARPPNWWGTGASQDLLVAARSEGLPLAWTPPPETIKEMNAAGSREERLKVLEGHRKEIIDDCLALLGACDEAEIAGSVELARSAIDALKDGHHQAGMALAVSLGEPLAKWASTPRVRAFWSKEDRADWEKKRARSHYEHARIEIDRLPPGDVAPWDFRYQVLIAPIPRFYTPWFPDKSTPMPAGLSRHVVAHQPTPEHLSETNALLAIMLVVSILREQQEWTFEVRTYDAGADEDRATD
jgi:hypothetical protein